MPAPSRNPASKTVSFIDDAKDGELASILCEIPGRDDYKEDEDGDLIQVLFFNRDDYRVCRTEAKTLSGEVDFNNKADCLLGAFGEKSTASQEKLNAWTTSEVGCRGLERWSNRAHGEKRQTEQFAAIMGILQAQWEMSQTRNNRNTVNSRRRHSLASSSSEVDHKTKDIDALRKVASRATRNARHFARMLGKADSYAVALELKKDEELQRLFPSLPIFSEAGGSSSKPTILPQRQREDDEVSASGSVSTTASTGACNSVAKISASTSLLSMSSDDRDGLGSGGGLLGEDEEGDEVEFFPPQAVDEIQYKHESRQDEDGKEGDMPGTPRRSKTRKLRLLKKIKRRMSASSSGGSSRRRERTILFDTL